MSFWNLTIDDSSPSLNYTPFNWSIQNSSHVTSVDSASVNLRFNGAGIYIYGATSSPYDVTLDNTTLQGVSYADDNILFNSTNLTEGDHNLILTARPHGQESQLLAFDRAIILTRSSGDAAVPIVYDNNNSSALSYSAGWTLASTPGVPNGTIAVPYHTTNSRGSSMTFSFTEATGIAIHGMLNAHSGQYSVCLSGACTSYNGTSANMNPDALMFFQLGLDPNSNQEVIITNTDDHNGVLSINSVTMYRESVPSTTPPSTVRDHTSSAKSNKARTAGIVAGVLSAVILLSLLALFFLRRRDRNTSATKSMNYMKSAWVPARKVSVSSSPDLVQADGDVQGSDYGSSFGCSQSPFPRNIESEEGGSSNHFAPADSFEGFPASPLPSARSTAGFFPSNASSAHSGVVVTNDRNGATVMYWSPSERSRPNSIVRTGSPSCSSITHGSSVNALSEAIPLQRVESRPQSMINRRPSPIQDIPPTLTTPFAAAPPQTRRSIAKRRYHRPLPQYENTQDDHPMHHLEMDAGRLDENMLMLGPAVAEQFPSDAPPPEYRREDDFFR